MSTVFSDQASGRSPQINEIIERSLDPTPQSLRGDYWQQLFQSALEAHNLSESSESPPVKEVYIYDTVEARYIGPMQGEVESYGIEVFPAYIKFEDDREVGFLLMCINARGKASQFGRQLLNDQIEIINSHMKNNDPRPILCIADFRDADFDILDIDARLIADAVLNFDKLRNMICQVAITENPAITATTWTRIQIVIQRNFTSLINLNSKFHIGEDPNVCISSLLSSAYKISQTTEE